VLEKETAEALLFMPGHVTKEALVPVRTIVVSVAVLAVIALCVPGFAQSQTDSSAPLSGQLIIFNAGSLAVPVKELSAAFHKEHPGVNIVSEASGSRDAARKVSQLGRQADLVMSADYSVIDTLLMPEFASWDVIFARNTMVIAYTAQSEYASEINAKNWYQVLQRKGVIYGHSDPNVDPCGYRTLLVWHLAQTYYGVPGLYKDLVADCPPANIRPKEVDLVPLLQSGDMDYAFEYQSVAVQHGLKYISLPEKINLSHAEDADFYKQASVEINGAQPGTTMTVTGAPILYGVTMVKNAPHPQIAVAFLEFLFGPKGQAILEQCGQPPVVPAQVEAGKADLPAALVPFVK
jgi:molybdate/tungstate transport system substrate-binding protein